MKWFTIDVGMIRQNFRISTIKLVQSDAKIILQKKRNVAACLGCEGKDIFVNKKLVFPIFSAKKMTKYEICVRPYYFKWKEKIDVFACLEFLNNLQEKYGFSSAKWSPFHFNYFNANDGIYVYQFVSENEKKMKTHLWLFLFSCYFLAKKMAFQKEHDLVEKYIFW